MEKIRALNPSKYIGLDYISARSELRRLTKLASETGQEVAVIPHLNALKDVMDSTHPGIAKRPTPPIISGPPVVIIGEEIDSMVNPKWFYPWMYGLFIGISIGLIIAKFFK